MKLSFRIRIVLTLTPLLALLAALGGTATVLIYRIGNRIDQILKENYHSVRYMQDLREAVEKIDSSFQLANALVPDQQASAEYLPAWKVFDTQLEDELNNITIPGEQEAANELARLGKLYRKRGDAFYKLPPRSAARRKAYLEKDGLKDLYDAIKKVSWEILVMNQRNMEEAEEDARNTAHRSLVGFTVGVLGTVVLALWLAWYTTRATLRPVRQITESALAIGKGNLDQVVPVTYPDELGQMANAFNVMARQLREFRQSGTARLMRAQQTSQATIDSFPDPIVVVDAAGKVHMANPAAQQVFGVHGPTSPSNSAAVWTPPGELAGLLQEALRTQQPCIIEDFNRVLRFVEGGQERFFLPRILPISAPSGETLGAAVLLQDVTRFRLLDQVKSDLVATVSHELKTPLTSIRLAVHLLLEEMVGPLTPKQTELLIDARDNGERLLRMVNNMLDLTRLEKGKLPLHLQAEKPAGLIESALDPLRPRAVDKGVEVVVEIPPDVPEVAADAQQVALALGNLFDNALTYTPAGGRITISAAQTGDTVMFAVADTGIGIAPEHVPHIFDKFYRIPGQSSAQGSGLGLAIVREVIQAHGGRVACSSHPGAGSVFQLTLPIWNSHQGGAHG
jgi:signal transduction histidine kinase/HAMP domain-containing protein